MVSRKGGVGKTTIAFHISHFLSEHFDEVIAIDLDPQAHLTLAFGLAPEGKEDGILPSPRPVREGLRVVPSGPRLARFDTGGFHLSEIERMVSAIRELAKSGNKRKENKEKGNKGKNGKTVLVVDSPPSLGNIFYAATSASDIVIIPAVPSGFSVLAVGEMLEEVSAVRRHLNRRLRMGGVVLNMVSSAKGPRWKAELSSFRGLSEVLADGDGRRRKKRKEGGEGWGEGGDLLGIIPRSIKVEEALQRHVPVTSLFPAHPASHAFAELGGKIKSMIEERMIKERT